MDNLRLLQLNFVQLTGSYENFSEHLRWLCWFGFHLRTIPSTLFMGNLVALDMSYSNLEVFEPPMVLQSLQILNLKDSHNLLEIRNISRLPNLETLILWNCHNLVRVCETIGGLTSLALLNMTGCENLWKGDQSNPLVGLDAFISGGGSTQQPSFPLPHSLQRLFLKDCYLECTEYSPLSFSVQPFLQYLNLGNSLFEVLPYYNHLRNLRVLDLSLCSRLKWLLCLPSTLAELYVYYCKSLEKITFESHRFRLQEFGYEGCINLSEIEGFIKLVPIAKLDDTDLGHMKWLKEYQNHEVCLVGDDELTIGRSSFVQMLYEFDIMSTSLPDIRDPNMMPEYMSESPSLYFEVPLCPKNRKLKGLNVTFKYTISGEDWAWFAKINTSNGVDLMYNPKVFGKPAFGEVATWLSYWPIGNTLFVGDTVNVSISVIKGLEVCECGASLVYADDDVANKTLETNMGWEEILGGDLSGFQLSTGAYYLCRRDFFELTEVGRLTPGWFRILVGDTVDYTEIRGWRKTGRPKLSNPSFTELKTVRCIIHGPESEEVYKIAKMSKSHHVDKLLTSISLTEKMESSISESRKFSKEGPFDQPSVASPSSSSIVASMWEKSSSLDVYLRFAPCSFLFGNTLSDVLARAGLRTYPFSELLLPPVLTAIAEAKASVLILSEDCADLSWYLDELVLILERRRNSNHLVLPVFYNVEPSDVRGCRKCFALKRFQASAEWMGKVDLWKAALREVAILSGFVVSGADEVLRVGEEIARSVCRNLYPSPLAPYSLRRHSSRRY